MLNNFDSVLLCVIAGLAILLGKALGRGIRAWILFFRTLPPKSMPPPPTLPSSTPPPVAGPTWANSRLWESEHLRDTRYGAQSSREPARRPPPFALDEDNEVIETLDEKDIFL